MAVVAQFHGVLELNFIVSGTAEMLAAREHLDPEMDEKSVSHAVDVMRGDDAARVVRTRNGLCSTRVGRSEAVTMVFC